MEIRLHEESDFDEIPITAHIDETDEAAVCLDLTLSQILTVLIDEYYWLQDASSQAQAAPDSTSSPTEPSTETTYSDNSGDTTVPMVE